MSVIRHEISESDAQAMQQVRAVLSQNQKFRFEPASRAPFDQIIGQAPAPKSVTFEQGKLGRVSGWWCRPSQVDTEAVMLYLHGGGYVIGSASAYRNFVGQIAKRAQAAAFVADYALAPEEPFPAAWNEIREMHECLVSLGYARVALCGDSAGGGLVLSYLTDKKAKSDHIVGIVAMSPWIDLSLSGDSMVSRDAADPILSKATLAQAAASYLAGQNLKASQPSPLDGDLSAMPPVRIDVGNDEVLLDDSLRFAKKAEQAGLNCAVHVWEGMIHVFPSNFAMLQASAQALGDIGAFLARVLGTSRRAPPSHAL